MQAPYVRSTPRQLVIALATVIGAAVATPTTAQSARRGSAIPVAFVTSIPTLGPTHAALRCIAVFSAATAIRPDSDARRETVQVYSADDSADFADDAIDPDALTPGSGMVLVDPHGKIIEAQTPRVASVEISPTDCCPAAATWTAALVANRTTGSYTASNGSATRARCVDAMNPPPSSRSPL